MKVKAQQFRKSIATQQRNAIMSNIRQKLIKYMEAQSVEEQINNNIQISISNLDIETCYQEFIFSNKQMFTFIKKDLIVPCYELFTSNLTNEKCIEMLQHLALKYFQETFVNRQLNLLNRHILNVLCGLVPICVSQIISQQYYSQSQSVNQRLNSYLGIIGMYFQSRYKQYVLQESNEEDKYKAQQIMSWSSHLMSNKQYLQILANLVDNHQYRPNFNPHLVSLINNQNIFDKLIDNVFASQPQKSFISCYIILSLIELNPLIHQKRLEKLLPNILKILLNIYDKYTHKENFYKQIHFIKCLKCLKILLDQIIIHNKIIQYKLFSILRFINQVYYFPQKYITFQILELVLQIIVQLGYQKIYQIHIPQEIKESLALGLQNKLNLKISLSSMRTIKRLVRHFDNSQQMIEQFIDYGVPTILESLQFNQNQEISFTSISLLQSQFRQQNYSDTNQNIGRYQNMI